MQITQLDKFTGGWFIGDFIPSIIRSKDFEVGIKTYCQGDSEPTHYHKFIHEITIVVRGKVRMCGQVLSEGDIILIEPYEPSEFKALEDCTLCVVKLPSIPSDKFSDIAE